MITRANYETRSEFVLKSLGGDNLSQRRTEHMALLMYKVVNGDAPKYPTQRFTKAKENNPYNLRKNELELSYLYQKLNI